MRPAGMTRRRLKFVMLKRRAGDVCVRCGCSASYHLGKIV